MASKGLAARCGAAYFVGMHQIDLEPRDYAVKGRKEPILNKGWWLRILIFIAVIVFGQVAIRPVLQAVHAYMMSITD